MPDIIKVVDIEGEEKYGQKNESSYLFLFSDGFSEEIQRRKYKSNRTAINIRKNIVTTASYGGFKACEVICEEVKEGEIAVHFIGKGA